MTVLVTVGKVRPSHPLGLLSLVAQAGFEPTRAGAHRLPGPERLPFRHCAVSSVLKRRGYLPMGQPRRWHLSTMSSLPSLRQSTGTNSVYQTHFGIVPWLLSGLESSADVWLALLDQPWCQRADYWFGNSVTSAVHHPARLLSPLPIAELLSQGSPSMPSENVGKHSPLVVRWQQGDWHWVGGPTQQWPPAIHAGNLPQLGVRQVSEAYKP